eukprot:RCo019481
MSFLTLLNPDLPGQCDPSDVEKGGWFFHPSEYLAPCAAMTVPSVVALAWLFYGYSLYSPARQYKWRKPLSPRVRSTARLLQPFLCVLMVACWVFTCTLKVIKGGPLQAAYMLQPCHIVHAMLTFCTLSSSRLAHIVFDVALSWLFSVVLGIVANWDLSVYTVRFELENWILQHMLLLFLPFYYLYTHRFAPFGQAEFWFGHCLGIPVSSKRWRSLLHLRLTPSSPSAPLALQSSLPTFGSSCPFRSSWA